MRKIILTNRLKLEDVTMLTAAVRDLHLSHPGQFLTDIRTDYPQLLEHNPHVNALSEADTTAEVISCEIPVTQMEGVAPYHLATAYTQHLSNILGINIEPTLIQGDIYVSETEKSWISQVQEITESSSSFWLVSAEETHDAESKAWSPSWYQEVIDHFIGRILFVQVGESSNSPPWEGVIDLRGRTDLRQLIRLVYHSQGILCPASSIMHLAAAIETPQPGLSRPCVVIAGKHGLPQLEAYPGHRFLHIPEASSRSDFVKNSTDGTLPGTLEPHDEGAFEMRQNFMDLIQPEQVVSQIESYFFPNGPWKYLRPQEADRLASLTKWNKRDLKFQRARTDSTDSRWSRVTNGDAPLTVRNVAKKLEQAACTLPKLPDVNFRGRGIVTCAGGLSYLPSAWVSICMLRQHGCDLPIELWHFKGEVDDRIRALLEEKGVQCVECDERITERGGTSVGSGWEMKPKAILYSNFAEVLFLDADNMAVSDPSTLFDSEEFSLTGAIFWPDYTSLASDDPIWKICDIPYRDEPEFESGQILIDKVRHWKALQLAVWFNRNAGFFRHYFLGDKETFHFAFRFFEIPYSMPNHGIENLVNRTMCQHDFSGNRLFQHRNLAKWSLHGANLKIPGFKLEKECFEHLRELRKNWEGRTDSIPRWKVDPEKSNLALRAASEIQGSSFYLCAESGENSRILFGADGRLHSFPKSEELLYWDIKQTPDCLFLLFSSETRPAAELRQKRPGEWRGRIFLQNENGRIQVSKQKRIPLGNSKDPSFRILVDSAWAYRVEGQHQRSMEFASNGAIPKGAGSREVFWSLKADSNNELTLCFRDWEKETVCFRWNPEGFWNGSWLNEIGTKVSLRRLRSPLPNLPIITGISRSSRTSLTIPSQSDCDSQTFEIWCDRVKEEPRYHRRQWELITTLTRIEEHLKQSETKRLLVVNPENNSLVDSLALLGPDIICVLSENWKSFPPSRRIGRLNTAKRELNCKGITPSNVFADRVQVVDSAGEIPYAKIRDSSKTALIMHIPVQQARNGDIWPLVSDVISNLPNAPFILLVCDILLEPSTHTAHSVVSPPSLEMISHWLRKNRFGPSLQLPDESLFGPVDTYIDSKPYQQNHHLRISTPHGIISSACLLIEK
ncbi:MAG: glycosyltransferase family 9 protein [Verrucomicrobiota bacterium]